MKKILLGIGIVGAIAFSCQVKSQEQTIKPTIEKGYQIYKNKCAACHWETVSPEQVKDIRKTVMRGGRPPFGAPPMSEVSARVKKFYPTEEKFVAFVKDYITNPSREKGVCMPMAYKVFGVMPPIGKSMTEEEKEAVAKWLYHRYKMTWEEFMRKHPH